MSSAFIILLVAYIILLGAFVVTFAANRKLIKVIEEMDNGR